MPKKTKARQAFKKRRDFLPLSKPSLGAQEIEAVVKTIKGGWITTGSEALRFEEEFKKYTGAKHAVALNSCTCAISLALKALNVKSGDEVILSPFTFVSQANSIVHHGAVPVFADIKRDTLNINPGEILKKITKKTKAIIVTHFAGQPCERDTIKSIASSKGIPLIEDAAHALGAEWSGKKIGADPDTISTFSFYPIKNITTAEGGMLTTGSSQIAERVRVLSLHGLSKGAWKRYSHKGSWEYDVKVAGYKCNMPDILAAMGAAQLGKIEKFNRHREKLACTYMREISKIEELTMPSILANTRHAWQIFPVLTNNRKTKISRNNLAKELARLNIGTSVHFKPIHLFTLYKKTYGSRKSDLQVAENVYRRILSLPLFNDMTMYDLNYVVKALKFIFSQKIAS